MGRASTIALRTAIVLVALGAAAAVLSTGLDTQLSGSHPLVAARIAPYDARVAMAAAQAQVAAGKSVDDPQVRRLVATALARDATLPGAIEYRALEAESDRDEPRAARLFELSSAISRRSLPTRLWLIQRAVDRGDVEGALKDFDIALRTSSAAPDILFPVLARAAADPHLAAPMARTLDRPSDWRVLFLNYAITQGHAPAGVSDIVLRMQDRRAITDAEVDQTLIGQLTTEQDFALAHHVYDAFHPAGSGGGLVRDADFSHPEMSFPFGWRLTDRGEAGAARSLVGGKSVLTYRSLPGGEGQVAAQLLTLAPGGYRLSAREAADANDDSSPPYWSVTCAEAGGAQIALLDQPTSGGGEAAGEFEVPAGCPAQWLALWVRASDTPSRTGSVASVAVTRR